MSAVAREFYTDISQPPQQEGLVESSLNRIYGLADPNEAFLTLRHDFKQNAYNQAILSATEIDMLFDFAADPNSTDSLYVRAQAVETAFTQMSYHGHIA